METVATLSTERAHLLRAELEAAGLYVTIQSEDGSAQLPAAEFCKARVQVSEDDLIRARELAREFEAQGDAVPEPTSPEQNRPWAGAICRSWGVLEFALVGVPCLVLLVLWIAQMMKHN